nr:putative ribonuclease H-like domain-containing protein [Tanacetum cinerariifolium]
MTVFLLGPKVHDVSAPMELNLDYAKELARLQRQEHEAHSAATNVPAASNVVVDPVATKRVNTIHPQSHIIGELQSLVQTRSTVQKSKFGEKPSSVAKSLADPDWAAAMQEEMQQFYNQQVWKLLPLPAGKIVIRTKWILKKKKDARGIVVRNKARLVVQGHKQEEGINYDEVFASVARIEAIRLFLAFASYMGFMVYQMDVKSAFLYGEIEEEVYVTQPKGFEDPHNPRHVYRVVKALYGLHQAPRAWYARLSTYLLKHHYRRGTIDKTLFLKKDSRHIILVQVYVDDIIFGSTNKAWCDEFEVLMKGEFEMSAMGELTFFLGLKVKQLPDGIFISQDKYGKDMLKKFDMKSVRTATTPYEVPKHKSKDEPDDAVNVHLYRSMIGSLMYMIASRPDIMFAISACSRHQVILMSSHLNVVKKIFKYLKGQPTLGLWYLRDYPFLLEAYSDSDYAGSHGDRKSTTGGCQFLVAVVRDANEKNLIQVLKIHTDENVADLLTKAFDGPRFHYLVYVYILTHSCRLYLVYCRMTAVSCGFLLYVVQILGRSLILLVVPVFLLVVLVLANGWVPTGSCTIPTALLYKDDHNKVAYLEKGKGWEAYEQILDFLNRLHIRYALTHRPPIVFDTLVKQFWATATVRTLEAGPFDIIATIDGNEVVVSESLIRTQLQLNDANALYKFTLHDVLDGMRDIGYPTDGSLTFYKAKLSPQLRFLIHTLIHCMIPKSGGGISSLTTDPCPRPTFDFTTKQFSNMKLNWDGPHMPLLAPMLVVPAGGDGAAAVAAGVAAAHNVPSPPPPPIVPPTHSSSSILGPFTAAQATPVRELTPVREPTPMREPTPSPVREPTPFREPTTNSPRPPSLPLYPQSKEGGGDFVSSPKSNEALQTPAATAVGGVEDSATLTTLSLKLDRCINGATSLENKLGVTKKVLGGAILKLVTKVKRLEGLLQQRKQRLALSDSEDEESASKEQDIDLDALHKLVSTSLGGDSTVEAAYTIYKASQDAHASSNVSYNAAEVLADTTMPFSRTSTTRRRPRKPFTSLASDHFPENISAVEDTLPAGEGIPAAAPTIPTGSTTIPAGSSMDPAGQAAAAAPSSTIPAADKGKAPMVDDSLPVDLLSKQERILKNLHDYQLGEELAKKLHAEQEAEFARQQVELAQKSQAESVVHLLTKLLGDDVNVENMNERLGMLLMRKRRELAEQSRVKPMNKTQQRDYMRDFVKNQSASVYNQGWTMKQVKALSLSQLKHEFEYIQRTFERSNLHNFKRTTFRPAPSLEAPYAKRAIQEVPQDVHAASSQVPASVLAVPLVATIVLVPDAPSVAADVSVLAIPPDPAVDYAHVDTEVHADESNPDDTPTASEQVSAEHTVVASTPSSSRTHRKHLAKKRVTPIVDIVDDALIKFDSASDSDDDPLPYAPYAGWEIVPSPLGSIHAYHDMEGHTRHFTSLHELLHMVEKNDLRRLLGVVDNLYQREEPDTFSLLLWGELHVLFQSLDDEDARDFWRNQDGWRIHSWRLYPRAQVYVLETVDGRVIYMFVDVSYPLSATTLQRMLKHGLEVPKLLLGTGLSDQRRRELDAAQLIYTEADWLELMAKIATNSTLSKQLLGNDVNEENMNERLENISAIDDTLSAGEGIPATALTIPTGSTTIPAGSSMDTAVHVLLLHLPFQLLIKAKLLCAVVVVLWWGCGGVVVVGWGCGGGVVLLLWLLFSSGVVVVNMENYEDDPVTLTCRSRHLRHNILDWRLRLIDAKKTWEIYPWGSLVWAQLYGQLENANDGAQPNRRLRPDAFEAKAEWWVRNQEFFDGRIHEAPPITTLVKLPSRYDVSKYVNPCYNELINSIKELTKNNDAHEKLLKEVYNLYQGQSKSKPVEVRKHYGGCDKTGLKPSRSRIAVRSLTWLKRPPMYPKTFEEPILSRHPTSHPSTSRIATPMAL